MKIFLIGLPGAGKTSVGQELARYLNMEFVDLDAAIEAKAGRTISEIFAREGESGFRTLETAALRAAIRSSSMTVISTGGGLPTKESNVRVMQAAGPIIWLDISVSAAARRTRGGGRPLLDRAKNKAAALAKLAHDRVPLYAACASYRLDSSESGPAALAEHIISYLGVVSVVPLALATRSYPIVVGNKIFGSLPQLVNELTGTTRVAVMIDGMVDRLHGRSIRGVLKRAGFKASFCVVPPGERSKAPHQLNRTYDFLAASSVDRSTPLLAIGGGVVGDLAGFAAATWNRGIPLIHVPTTLLAQVDSSIGGKTAINHATGKNRIGAFYQPRAVFTDLDFLTTLPGREFHAGLGEVLKYGIALDADFCAFLQAGARSVRDRSLDALWRVVLRCARLKSDVVAQDELETTGQRIVLNAGHTVGHALEAAGKYARWFHGEAVAVGLALETRLACNQDICGTRVRDEVAALVGAYGFPTDVPLKGAARFVGADKKRVDASIVAPLVARMGQTRNVELPISLWKKFLESGRRNQRGES